MIHFIRNFKEDVLKMVSHFPWPNGNNNDTRHLLPKPILCEEQKEKI